MISSRRYLILPLVAALALAACDASDKADGDAASATTLPASDSRVDPAVGDVDADDAGAPRSEDQAGGSSAPAETQTLSGRVVGVDRDGPSVEIVEVRIVTGDEATEAARANGEIGPDEEWDVDFYVDEGERRWLDLEPGTSVAVFDCTRECEHVAGTLEHLFTGAPYGGKDAVWTFELLDGKAVGAEEFYLP